MKTALKISFIFFPCVFFSHISQWDVDRYQSQHSFVWEYGASLVDIAQPQAGERVLDVGCGSGELTHALAKRGSAVMGMDADANMVRQAQAQYPDLEFWQGNAANFALDEQVDLIFSNAALHWVQNADNAVQCMAQALKPGGRFVAEFGGKGNVDQIVRACQDVLSEDYGVTCPNPWYFPSISEYSTLLERHGIEVTRAELYDRPTVLQDGKDGMSNWIRMFGSQFLDPLQSQKDISDFLTRVSSRLEPNLFDGEQWTADYRRIRVVGRKIEDE